VDSIYEDVFQVATVDWLDFSRRISIQQVKPPVAERLTRLSLTSALWWRGRQATVS